MSQENEHVQTYTELILVFVLLLVLTAITVTVSRLELGAFAIWAALLIAACKSILVLMYFMHLRYTGRLIAITFGVTVFTLAIIIAFLFWDISFR